MASGSTTNRAVPYPLETDVPDAAADMHTLATYIDGNNAKVTSGTSLPGSATLGDEFLLTTTGVWFKYSGTAWLPMLVAGAYQALTLGSGLTAVTGAYVPSARREGDAVRFKGTLQNTSGSTISAGTTLFSVPSALANTQTSGAPLTIVVNEAGSAALLTAAAGAVAFSLLNTNLAATGIVRLDGSGYTLS